MQQPCQHSAAEAARHVAERIAWVAVRGSSRNYGPLSSRNPTSRPQTASVEFHAVNPHLPYEIGLNMSE